MRCVYLYTEPLASDGANRHHCSGNGQKDLFNLMGLSIKVLIIFEVQLSKSKLEFLQDSGCSR